MKHIRSTLPAPALLLMTAILIFSILILVNGSVDESGFKEQFYEINNYNYNCGYELIACYGLNFFSGINHGEKLIQIFYMLFSMVLFYIFFKPYKVFNYFLFLATFAFLYSYTQIEWGLALSIVLINYMLVSNRLVQIAVAIIGSMIHIGVLPLMLMIVIQKNSHYIYMRLKYVVVGTLLAITYFTADLIEYMNYIAYGKLGHYALTSTKDMMLIISISSLFLLMILFYIYFDKNFRNRHPDFKKLIDFSFTSIMLALFFFYLNVPVPMYRYLEASLFISFFGLLNIKFSPQWLQYCFAFLFFTLFWVIYAKRLF
jgi:hypothetical protein